MLKKLKEQMARTVMDCGIKKLRQIAPGYMPMFPDDAKVTINFFGSAKYDGNHFQLPASMVRVLSWDHQLPGLDAQQVCKVFKKFGLCISDVQVTRIVEMAASNLLRWSMLNSKLKLDGSTVNPIVNMLVDAAIGKLEYGPNLMKNIIRHYTPEGLVDSIGIEERSLGDIEVDMSADKPKEEHID